MEPMKPERYPMDFEVLERGSVISREDVQHILNVENVESNAFRFGLMALQEKIETHFLDDRGDLVDTYTEQGALHICTHSEQAARAPQTMGNKVRAALKANRKFMAVNTALLNDAELDAYRKASPRMAWRTMQLSKPQPRRLGNNPPTEE